MDIVTLTYHGQSYRINNPGEGRIGSKLNMGTAYELKLLEDAYELGLKGSVFDVGAHIGNHTLYFGAVCGLKVYAWEPYPDSLKQLYDNLALNDLDVEVFDWAAGAQESRGKFTRGMWLEFDPSRQGDKLKLERGEVPVHRIDDMIDIPDLALVKIDVEGMEPDVLMGMTRHIQRSRPVIYCETHNMKAQNRIESILGPFGYKLRRVINMGSPQHRWDP